MHQLRDIFINYDIFTKAPRVKMFWLCSHATFSVIHLSRDITPCWAVTSAVA